MMILKEFSRIVCVSLFSYQGSLFVCLSDSSFTLSHSLPNVNKFFKFFIFFFVFQKRKKLPEQPGSFFFYSFYLLSIRSLYSSKSA